MSFDALADEIARRAIASHCNAYYVCATQHQQEKVIADAKAQILVYLTAHATPKPE